MTEALYLSRAKLSTRLAFVAAGFGVACWAPMVPFAKTRCHLGDDTLGLVLLLLGAGSIVAMPLAANLSARFSSKPVVLAGGIGLAILLPLLSIVSSPIEAACRERQEKGITRGNSEHTPKGTKDFRPRQYSHL